MIDDNRRSSGYIDADQAAVQLRKEIRRADAIVIGAGAGLSASAGFSSSGERFYEYFQDFGPIGAGIFS